MENDNLLLGAGIIEGIASTRSFRAVGCQLSPRFLVRENNGCENMRKYATTVLVGLVIMGGLFFPLVSALDWSPTCEVKSVSGIYQVGNTVQVTLKGTPNQNPDYPTYPIDRFHVRVFYGDYGIGTYPSSGSSDYIIDGQTYNADSNGEATFSFLIGKEGKINIVARCYDDDNNPSESDWASFYAQPQTTQTTDPTPTPTPTPSQNPSPIPNQNDEDSESYTLLATVILLIVIASFVALFVITRKSGKPPTPPQYQQPPYYPPPPPPPQP